MRLWEEQGCCGIKYLIEICGGRTVEGIHSHRLVFLKIAADSTSVREMAKTAQNQNGQPECRKRPMW